MNKNRIIYELWRMLDNIDTASDAYKDNYEELAKFTYREQRKRFNVVDEKSIDKLYEKYYNKDLEG